MELRLITGTPGMKKGQVVGKITREIVKHSVDGRTPTVGFGSVEKKLRALGKIALGDRFPKDPEQQELVTILAMLPQDKVRGLWREAFQQALTDATEGEPDLAIITASLSYYRRETYEFYSPVDLKMLIDLQRDAGKPVLGGILTLIDDMYDVYHRLSRSGHVFDIQRLVASELVEFQGSETSRYKRALSLVIQCLIRVLEWRESEIQAAAALSAALGAPVATLAVKHPIETGARLLLGEACPAFGLGSTFPTYLSHPITLPREHNGKTGDWPDFVDEFAGFIEHLRSQSENDWYVAPIMPTAIDECRFLQDGDKRLPYLSQRWPLPRGDLLYCGAEGHESYEVYERDCLQRIFDPPLDKTGRTLGLPQGGDRLTGMLAADNEVAGMLSTLEAVIKLQMANRDHLLVRQCPGFLLYRPTYEDPPRFTGGVKAEIKNHHDLREFGNIGMDCNRPIAFVHSLADLQRIFDRESRFSKTAAQTIMAGGKEILDLRYDIPGDLRPATLAEAMQAPGAPDPFIDSIHNELVPPERSSVGDPEQPSAAAIKVKLKSAILEERARLLCMYKPNVGWVWHYCHIDADGTHAFSETNANDGESHVLLAAVVDNLESADSQRIAAADAVRKHFAQACAPPAAAVDTSASI